MTWQDQMLRYYNTYQYDSGLYELEYYPSEDESSEEDESLDEDDSGPYEEEEDEDESSDEDDEWDENRRSCSCSDDFCSSRVSSTGRYSHFSYDENHVCLCDPTFIYAKTCCCNYLGLLCNGKCRPDGYDRWLESRPSYQKRHQNPNRMKRSP